MKMWWRIGSKFRGNVLRERMAPVGHPALLIAIEVRFVRLKFFLLFTVSRNFA